jgi:hypothetical protein
MPATGGGAVCVAAACCVSKATAAKLTTIRQPAVRRFAALVIGWAFPGSSGAVGQCSTVMFNFDGRP